MFKKVVVPKDISHILPRHLSLPGLDFVASDKVK